MACLDDITVMLVVKEPVQDGVAELLEGLCVDGGRQKVALLQACVLHCRVQLVLRRGHAPARLQILAHSQQCHLQDSHAQWTSKGSTVGCLWCKNMVAQVIVSALCEKVHGCCTFRLGSVPSAAARRVYAVAMGPALGRP